MNTAVHTLDTPVNKIDTYPAEAPASDCGSDPAQTRTASGCDPAQARTGSGSDPAQARTASGCDQRQARTGSGSDPAQTRTASGCDQRQARTGSGSDQRQTRTGSGSLRKAQASRRQTQRLSGKSTLSQGEFEPISARTDNHSKTRLESLKSKPQRDKKSTQRAATRRSRKRQAVKIPDSIVKLIDSGFRISGKLGAITLRVRNGKQQFYTQCKQIRQGDELNG